MKISGETFKLKTPVQAGSVLENHPGYVLLASESVVHSGARAKPLEPHQELKPRRLYFLVELPKLPEEKGMMRRVRSGIHMTAKDRLESMMLARRSASDVSATRKVVTIEDREGIHVDSGGGGDGGVRVRLRLPKAEVERLMAESKDDGADVAEKIVGLCMGGAASTEENVHWSGDRGLVGKARQHTKSREKRVGFLPINEGEIHVAAASES